MRGTSVVDAPMLTTWTREARHMAAKHDTLIPSDLEVAEMLRRRGMTYLSALPKALPGDRVLVHNRVRPTRSLGSRGFRAWLQNDTDNLDQCDCGFVPELGTHYRVRLRTDE